MLIVCDFPEMKILLDFSSDSHKTVDSNFYLAQIISLYFKIVISTSSAAKTLSYGFLHSSSARWNPICSYK